jgi:hypothetical protein
MQWFRLESEHSDRRWAFLEDSIQTDDGECLINAAPRATSFWISVSMLPPAPDFFIAVGNCHVFSTRLRRILEVAVLPGDARWVGVEIRFPDEHTQKVIA